MNVFEDLIGELKDENLLEDTVIEVKKKGDKNVSEPLARAGIAEERAQEDLLEVGKIPSVNVLTADQPGFVRPSTDKEFFCQRAMEEVSSLQMVEHVLSGVEREHMKMPSAPYDDLEVKKALHRFVQISKEDDLQAQTEAEYELLQETQGWHTALSARDKNVSVANIRRYCENSRPVLSSQALMALARFYRNSPFTEEVRSKFDFIMTRLFSRDAGLERRKLLFGREEMIGHIRTLYSNWSSISYYSSDEHQATIDLSVQRFNDLVKHFDTASSFDELLNADVFSTIRHYKEECGELFFAPEVTSAAIECNVRLGNRYVDLILKEKSEQGAALLEEKYGFSIDQIASNATGKTLLLSELLKDRPEDADFEEEVIEFEQESFDIPHSTPIERYEKTDSRRSSLFGVNKWLLAATILVTVLSGAMYMWADKFASSESTVKIANEIELEGTELKAHLRTLRTSNGTAYGVTQPSWDALTEDDQKVFLKKVLEFANKRGLTKVNLLNYKGRTVAFATKDRLDIYPPG